MKHDAIDNLLTGMGGSRLEEFCLRKSSARFLFTKAEGSRISEFAVETNSSFSAQDHAVRDYESAVTGSVLSVYSMLESTLSAIKRVSGVKYIFEFESGKQIVIQDTEGLWDNVFSVRVKGWPGPSDKMDYFI